MAVLSRLDAAIAYEVTGRGVPILFIQGIGVAGTGWRPQVEALLQGHRCLTFDNRGLGASVPCTGPITVKAMADDARALMDAVGWDSAHIAGHSMGGSIALQLALDHPDRVRSLSLMCTFARGSDGARMRPWVLWMTLRTRLGTRRMKRHAFLEMLFPASYLAQQDRDVLAAKLAPLIGRDLATHPPILPRQLRALAKHDVFSRLSELGRIPTWVVSGKHDPIARPDSGQRLAEAIPGASFDLVQDASHGLPLHMTAWVNQRLRAFLDEAEPRLRKAG